MTAKDKQKNGMQVVAARSGLGMFRGHVWLRRGTGPLMVSEEVSGPPQA